MLLEGYVNGHLPVGLSLQRIWKEGQKRRGINAVINKRAKNCGCKRIEIPVDSITAIPFPNGTTLEDLERGLGVSSTTVHKHLKRREN
jgi:hypothetical protein